MITVRKSEERGHFNHGWLDTYHTFSFASYFDPRFVGFGPLRVINEDRVQQGRGFGTHSHRDMEIISYVLDGELAHKDSSDASSTIRYGDVQRMTAGTGVAHSEFNPSQTKPVHFLQIWIHPEKAGLNPGYEEKHFDEEAKRGRLRLIASPDATDGSLLIHQDARVFASILDEGQTVTHSLTSARTVWLHVARGSIEVNGTILSAGDGAGVVNEPELRIAGREAGSELLLFDLPTN